tara:strand:- start:370 stop:555 length:186 start_codon:yes stop_codon:yes gene_type:complete
MKYSTRWKMFNDSYGEMQTTMTIHESDEWIDTGLVDAKGDILYRSEHVPMGIHVSHELTGN